VLPMSLRLASRMTSASGARSRMYSMVAASSSSLPSRCRTQFAACTPRYAPCCIDDAPAEGQKGCGVASEVRRNLDGRIQSTHTRLSAAIRLDPGVRGT